MSRFEELEPEYTTVPIDHIRHGTQYRKGKRAKPSKEMVKSIEATGGPLCLIQTRGAWEGEEEGYHYILDGHRRFQASQEAGMSHLKVEHYESITPEEAKAVSAITNVVRRNLTPSETKQAIDDLRALGHSDRYISDLLGTSRHTMAAHDKVSKRGTREVKSALAKGEVGVRTAGKIAEMPKKKQKAALNKVKKGKAPSKVPGKVKKTTGATRKSMGIPDCLRAPKPVEPPTDWFEKRRRPNRYKTNYPVHPKFKLLLQDFEWLTQYHLSDFPNVHIYIGYMNAIRLLKGEVDMGELFPGYGHIQPGGRKEHK